MRPKYWFCLSVALTFTLQPGFAETTSIVAADIRGEHAVELKPKHPILHKASAPVRWAYNKSKPALRKAYAVEQSRPVQAAVRVCADVGAVCGGFFYMHNFTGRLGR